MEGPTVEEWVVREDVVYEVSEGVTGGSLRIGKGGGRTTIVGDSRTRSWPSSPGPLLGVLMKAGGKGERRGRVDRRGTGGRAPNFR